MDQLQGDEYAYISDSNIVCNSSVDVKLNQKFGVVIILIWAMKFFTNNSQILALATGPPLILRSGKGGSADILPYTLQSFTRQVVPCSSMYYELRAL